MTRDAPQPKYRRDYRAPDYLVDDVDLSVNILPEYTEIRSTMRVRPNPDGQGGALRLDGREMALRGIHLDGQPLADDAYSVDPEGLTVEQPPGDAFALTIENRVHPDENTALEGWYRSGDILCTQCEPHGFSRITYFPDRPDVMARYRVTIEADRRAYPVLLANGDCVDAGDAADGRHYAVWEDPYRKPCYLFAMVAGDLARVDDRHVTGSGREVAIRFYTDPGHEALCAHAIASLKQAMAWDERTYGLEYDLDTYMVVAVDSFNMGAMENKGLNIFNSACVLASPETATDRDFATVRDVVAHEYFHNYTGNRVTCRDWFQLSLKESLTVFREQQFAADHDSPGVNRIDQVRMLRSVQFPEDAGPTAHPVRPESYVEMNNFYTITIYEKGAEVIRMMATILGREAFIAGVRHYLDKFDGQAVTIEDFVAALEASSGRDLGQFRHWYGQAGTPEISVREDYDMQAGEYRLTLRQNLPSTPGQSAASKAPMHIPFGLGLLDERGDEIELGDRSLLHLREPEQVWLFTDVPSRPTPALLRGFSAPVRLAYRYNESQLRHLLRHERDPFCRWEAAQQLYLRSLITDVEALAADRSLSNKRALYDSLHAFLDHPPADLALMAEVLSLPDESYLADQFDRIDVDAVTQAHGGLRRSIARTLADEFRHWLDECEPRGGYGLDVESVARRRLAGVCLGYLTALEDEDIRRECHTRYRAADNMTDAMAALRGLRDIDCEQRRAAFDEFEARWRDRPLVLDKWFALQATARMPNAVERVQALLEHPCFDLRNPNRVRAVLGSFARQNMPGFHRGDGAGYRLMADQVLALDSINPQIAARLAGTLSSWRRYKAPRREDMRGELERIRNSAKLSNDVHEIVDKSLSEQGE